MLHVLLAVTLLLLTAAVGGADRSSQSDTASRSDGLRLSVYVTADSVAKLPADPAEFSRAVERLRRLGVTKVLLEVYRGGQVVELPALEGLRDRFRTSGFEVAAGIATTPGGGFGVRQAGKLDWFNWQDEKTQRDLAGVVRAAAPLFDELIVDDFFCTADSSEESRAARGERAWSQYRMDLLVSLSEPVFLRPAREANPRITVTIKQVPPVVRPLPPLRLRPRAAVRAVRPGLGGDGDPRRADPALRLRPALRGLRQLPLDPEPEQ